MKIFMNIVLAILVLLAFSSGIVKIMLIEVEVQFYGSHGFTNSVLIAFGAIQLAGGLLLIAPKTRSVGGLIIAISFLISAVLLLISGNVPLAFISLVFVALACLITKQSFYAKNT